MLTGRMRHRLNPHNQLVLQVEEHAKPKVVQVGQNYATVMQTKWRDATVIDLTELHVKNVEDVRQDAYAQGFEDGIGKVAPTGEKKVTH